MIASLDLFSISQTNIQPKGKGKVKSDRKIYDKCANNAPYFAYQINGKKWGVVQGCCNDWNCPRCGHQRACEEYGRIVSGAREVAKNHQLYFMTLTCRGKDISIETAEREYIVWTNRLLTRLRAAHKRSHGAWFYASVTERQDRLHPHSHFITTYCPTDTTPVKKGEGKNFITQGKVFPAKHDTLQSYSLERAIVECGLGYQYDFSSLQSVEAGSRYAAKYLFKPSIFETIWPKSWRRVRYSQSWPKLPKIEGNAVILLTKFDWYKLSTVAAVIFTKDEGARKYVQANLQGDCIVH